MRKRPPCLSEKGGEEVSGTKLRWEIPARTSRELELRQLKHPTTRMVGRIVWAYSIVMCGQLLLCLPPWLLATAMPTPDNETVYDIPQRNNITSNVTTGVIWEITETAGNKSEENSDGLLLRGGWTSKKQNQKLELETDEGWLHSGIIAKDAFIPYRTVGASNRLGNSSEEWKNLLVKPEAEEKHGQARSSNKGTKRGIFHFSIDGESTPKDSSTALRVRDVNGILVTHHIFIHNPKNVSTRKFTA